MADAGLPSENVPSCHHWWLPEWVVERQAYSYRCRLCGTVQTSVPRTVDIVWFEWAIDPQGHPWVRHECTVEPISTIDTWRLPPPWHVTDEGVMPSLDCKRCGRHVILYECDRKPWEALAPTAATSTSSTTEESTS